MTSLYDKNSPETIERMFGAIASRYDRANALLSMGLHRRWNRALVREIISKISHPCYLDLCCGTADIAEQYVKNTQHKADIVLVDFCEQMLSCAKKKLRWAQNQGHHLTYLKANVEKLPLQDNSVGAATVAYGIRNVSSPRMFIREVARVLHSQSPFGILELTRPNHPILRLGHRLYLKSVLPLVGSFVTRNKEAYQYLCSSIQEFISPRDISQLMQEEGFENIRITSLTAGVATVIIGCKR